MGARFNSRIPLTGVLALVLAGLPLAGQAIEDGVEVVVHGHVRVFSGRSLDSLSSDTVAAGVHDRPAVKYAGVAVERLLALAGDTLVGLRGAQLARLVVVEAADGYRVVFGAAEVDPSITGRSILLTRAAGADGPWRLVVPGDRRGARWVRQVRTLRVVDAGREDE